MAEGTMGDSNAAMDVSSLSMFDGDGLPPGLSADMSGLGGDTTMSEALDQNGNGADGVDLDMLPMHLDLNLDDQGEQAALMGGQHQLQTQQQLDDVQDTNEIHDDINNTGSSEVGGGPLPTGFGVQATLGGGSTLTEFTKRRNWSHRVLEELRDFLHILTPDGRVLYISPSSTSLTGYTNQDLVGKFIVDYIHPDDRTIFVREFNESIATGNALRFFYRFRKSDGTYAIFESDGHPHLTSEVATFGPNNAAGFCRGFFMMARPYPTKNAALLDSFLEHKIENERLTKRIADLKREEQEDLEAQQRHLAKKESGLSDVTPSDTPGAEAETPGSTSVTSGKSNNYHSMPPPAKPGTSNTALTRQALDEANASSKPDSINDKMARYEGATHIETIEMLTGLRYRDGERSQGISTGDASPALIRGDAGIAIPVDKDNRGSADKKKKLKVADEYVCTDCGTLDSPEWRKGPSGPKTLCNACGLRWAKKEKKRTHTGPSGGGGGGMSSMGGPPPLTQQSSSGSGGMDASGNPPGAMMGGGPPNGGQSSVAAPATLPMQVTSGMG